ncbi:MAG: redoxin domain-containing protein [Geobacter sp.]|nr:redoxin domain-containing protein [Geobacter sp.]
MNQTKPLISVLLACLVAVALALPSKLEAAPRLGQPAPNFKVVTTSGQAVSLENYRGYVLIVDFFATWCQPCRQSIPHLVEMNRKYGKQGLQILGLSADENGERAVKSFAAEYRINYPLALAGDEATGDFGIRSVPVMFVIDKKGAIAEVYRGFSSEMGNRMEQLVKRLLAEK